MANVVIMPKQGQTVESCVITKWYKAIGDDVKAGDLLFSYETDKSVFDEEAKVEGKLLEILADEGDDVPCLSNVCIIGRKGEDVSSILTRENADVPIVENKAEKEKEVMPAAIPAQKSDDGGGFVSPRAKKAAERQGVDATLAVPTGANGRIMERDIYRLSDQEPQKEAVQYTSDQINNAYTVLQPPNPLAQVDYIDEKLSNVRKVIGRTMHESLSTMAQLTNNSSFDATELLEYRKQMKVSGNSGEDITINDMILFAVSRVLIKHPALNAHMLDDKLRLFNSANLGIAVDTDRGLLVPTLYNADKKTLSEISKESKALIAAARAGKIAPELLANGTFTVTNLGSLGVESFTPVINPPQTAILGVCKILTRVKEKDSALIPYPAMGLSLTYDHRAVDGAPAARFAKELGEMLENFHILMTV